LAIASRIATERNCFPAGPEMHNWRGLADTFGIGRCYFVL